MDPLKSEDDMAWHRSLNEFHKNKFGKDWQSWMYEAKHLAHEVWRMAYWFGRERTGQMPALHQQCSHQSPEPIADNHLTCCLGVECRKCPFLLALDATAVTPEKLDEIKAWTCASHILTESGKRMIDTSEGYILTSSDKMFWERTYANMGGSGDPDMDKLAFWGY